MKRGFPLFSLWDQFPYIWWNILSKLPESLHWADHPLFRRCFYDSRESDFRSVCSISRNSAKHSKSSQNAIPYAFTHTMFEMMEAIIISIKSVSRLNDFYHWTPSYVLNMLGTCKNKNMLGVFRKDWVSVQSKAQCCVTANRFRSQQAFL